MTEKELKKLTRAELLQLLLLQTQQTERLQRELTEVKAQLTDRRLRLQQAGDLAQAVLEVNNVVGAAQEAAKQYLENIEAMERETRAMREEARKTLENARAEAARIRGDSRKENKTAAEEAEISDEQLLKELHLLVGK